MKFNPFFVCISPNLQKITYQLLQERLKRQLESVVVERSTDYMEERLDICDTPTLLLSSSSPQSPSSYSNNTELTACDENSIQTKNNFTPTTERSSSAKFAFDESSGIVNENETHYFSLSPLPTAAISANTQAQPNSTTKPIIIIEALEDIPSPLVLYPNISSDKLLPTHPKRYYNPSIIISEIKVPSTQATFLSSISSSPELSPRKGGYRVESILKTILSGHIWSKYLLNIHQKQQIAKYRIKMTEATKHIKRKCDQLLSIFSNCRKNAKKTKHLRKIVRQEFSVQCTAKSEFVAAGQLHYILSDVSTITPNLSEKFPMMILID